MSIKYNIAVAGATGNVGREIIQILEDKEFPIDQLYLLASSRSKGQVIQFRGEDIVVEDLAEFDFSKAQKTISLATVFSEFKTDESIKRFKREVVEQYASHVE